MAQVRLWDILSGLVFSQAKTFQSQQQAQQQESTPPASPTTALAPDSSRSVPIPVAGAPLPYSS